MSNIEVSKCFVEKTHRHFARSPAESGRSGELDSKNRFLDPL